MKDTIEYYYSLHIDSLSLENDNYHFVMDNYDYYFVFSPRDEKEIEDIIACSYELKNMNIDCHEIIINNQNKIITKLEDVNYVLLRVKNKDEIYSITDIISMNKKLKVSENKTKLYRNNWAYLWERKIDYIENQLNEINVSKLISSSIDYYIGLAENAIYYVRQTFEKYLTNINLTLSHKRIYYPNYKLNYLNPLSFVFDTQVRDIAEYIKSFFFNDEDAHLELTTYLKSVKLDFKEYNLLFARLLYPSYYFDIYEKVINKKIGEENLLKIVKKQEEYEEFLKKAYKEITLYAPLENISWLIEKY